MHGGWRGRIERLSPKEREVCWLFSQGKTIDDIACVVGCGRNTVWHHLREAKKKLGLARGAQIGFIIGKYGEFPDAGLTTLEH
jgi:DNA-binding CsgD family transcriptional regulator